MAFLRILKKIQKFQKHPLGSKGVFSNILATLELVPNFSIIIFNYFKMMFPTIIGAFSMLWKMPKTLENNLLVPIEFFPIFGHIEVGPTFQ